MPVAIDPLLGRARLLLVVGKGGVGRTTVAATLAVRAASQGRRVLVVGVDGRSALASVLGGSDGLDARPSPVATGIDACEVLPERAFTDYLVDHGFGTVARRLQSSGASEVIASGIPGIKDLLVLGRIKSLVHSANHDLVIVDAPASGHAVTFVQSPVTLAGLVGSGMIRRQADEVLEVLRGPGSVFVGVTVPEETPVSEITETAAALHDLVGVRLDLLVVNSVLARVPNLRVEGAKALDVVRTAAGTVLRDALRYERTRVMRQREQLRQLEGATPGVPRVLLPALAVTGIGPAEVAILAELLGAR